MLDAKKTRRNKRPKKRVRPNRRARPRRLMGSLRLLAMTALILVMSALFVAGYAAVIRAAYFQAQSIRVTRMQRLTRQAVLTQAGITRGDNILAVNLRLVRKRLLAHPWIATALVAREIPQTITIEVVEQSPLAIADLEKGLLMNTQGRIFKVLGPDDSRDLPLITGLTGYDIILRDDPLTPAVVSVVELLTANRSARIGPEYRRIRRVHLDPEMGITLTTWKERREIKMGFNDYAARFSRLEQLLPYLERRDDWYGFKVIDVHNPDRVVVQLGSPPGKARE